MAKRPIVLATLLVVMASAVVTVLSVPSQAASTTVTMRGNKYNPSEVHIDPGDTVIWNNQDSRVHTVNADDGSFRSGDIRPGGSFSHQFDDEGYYYFYCKYHGGRGGVGMSGVVIVGNPPPPKDDGGAKDDRDILVVPNEFPTIQKAVDAAHPGAVVKIQPGTYHEAVTVKTPRLTIKGVDRYRTVLNGHDKMGNGFLVDHVNNVRISNLTVRNYKANGVFFHGVNGYKADHVDAIKDRTYGIYAFDSYNGIFTHDFAWGSGDGGFYIGECLGCGGLIEHSVSKFNYIGYSGTNATGVVIRRSIFKHNGAGIVPNTLPTEELAPNRGTFIYRNLVAKNNYKTVPASGFSETVSLPFGTGVWLAGTMNNRVEHNVIRDNNTFGVLVTESIDASSIPRNNEVVDNRIRNSDADNDGFGWDLAWTGEGENNCFANNAFKGSSGPPEIETLYACANRPFVGVPYPPVQAYVVASLCCPQTREQKEPPEPKRPDCQRGAPGCHRHRRHG
ncbi:MAG TPA: cupredoxin domain-containing protein [Actinomycetota bacterium]|nr:cupredoxin domain-containing protein [Actinomycetota bacterium]